ncbi:Hypothetical predicted protein [Mytilus galloprovincialis]|uniref:Uncharacterized protein n=1 Tax=Mytilus galloprovincialis TaxID=29158 RepID=A0A8B6HDB0_MYTGA|nr:Hypothetical predicted protein [Mytilus galloprovincialis]
MIDNREVSWCPKYNGGDPQTFFIEYRQEAGETWKRSGPIIDNMKDRSEDASANYNPVDEEVRENFQVEPLDNLLYISSDDHNLARTQNIRNQIVLDTTLSSTSSDNQIIQMQLLNGGLANGRRSCTYMNRGTVSAVLNPQNCDPSLQYSEITFNTGQTMRDPVIHGIVNRTIYSEIDLMAEPVAPLSSSESEYNESDDIDF